MLRIYLLQIWFNLSDSVTEDAIDYRINRRPHRLPKVSDHAAEWKRWIERGKYAPPLTA